MVGEARRTLFKKHFLMCYVLIDLKIDKITHWDLLWMLMYVHYYDRYEQLQEKNPMVGILLCKEKDAALVEMSFRSGYVKAWNRGFLK